MIFRMMSRLFTSHAARALAPLWLLTLVASAQNAPVPLPAGCVAWWRGEGNAADSAGTHLGTALNGVAYAPGVVGQAFSLDGIDDLVAVTTPLDFDSFSLEAWIFIDPATNTGSRHLFSRYKTDGTQGVGRFLTVVSS